ncbi:class I SAM-dependent methyltransferase [Niabella soli]|uniref:Methyltransferase type 11 n=1 Tax=Niabella soli DSM 19437 TaxID=929713 RepID=W0F455_9BACT|nr:class I SAM-dependent methyltransferase [Niabella soli]AHF16598.1 methyltransferase type 11 [Niabella soli DSM 19437]
MHNKSTIEEIEARFDKDVARFSNLETGQQTTLDASFTMELITDGIAAMDPHPKRILDIGCGAGNYPVKLLSKMITNPDITLADLSQPMLDKARERIQPLTTGMVQTVKGDFRTIPLEENSFDAIIATAVLHHLRDDVDWETAFARLYHLLRPGGSLWIFDLVAQEHPAIQGLLFKERYGHYLASLKDATYRDQVFAYIEQEDSPRSVMYQANLLKQAGFRSVDILHKNLCFASFVAFK